MTRFFYDTEFLERGPFHPINLISIGIVAEDGREYYGVNGEVELTPIANHAWLVENVVPHLPLSLRYVPHVALSGDTVYLPRLSWDEGNHEAMKPVRTRRQLRDEVNQFLRSGDSQPELWAWYGAYDHVVLAQLFGTMADLPDGLPMWTNDLKQELERVRPLLRLPQQVKDSHHPLADARWVRDSHRHLTAVLEEQQK